MKQKIREIAASSSLGGVEFDEGVRYYVATEETMEKFTLKIVQECIRCCSDVDTIQKHYLNYGIDQELGAEECIQIIKKHFEID